MCYVCEREKCEKECVCVCVCVSTCAYVFKKNKKSCRYFKFKHLSISNNNTVLLKGHSERSLAQFPLDFNLAHHINKREMVKIQ